MTHPFKPHSADHELTRSETWQSPLRFYWTGNKIHLLNSSPFLQPHQETFPLIWAFFSAFTSLHMWGCRALWIFNPFCILTAFWTWMDSRWSKCNLTFNLSNQQSLSVSGFVAADCPLLTHCSSVCGQHVVHVRSTCGHLRTQENKGSDFN